MTLHPLIGAALFVLAGSAGDYVLILPGQPPICAVDEASCEKAIDAVRRGWLHWDERDAVLRCQPSPGCFSPESQVIRGYNDR